MKLEIGFNHSYEIRREQYQACIPEEIKIAFLSDLHLNRYSEALVTKLIQDLANEKPDIILFGGDYVDGRKGLTHLKNLLAHLPDKSLSVAIAGNHDKLWRAKVLKDIFNTHKVLWIEKQSTILICKNVEIAIAGNFIGHASPQADLSILLLHTPLSIEPQRNSYNLVFAGHLHGCQIVLWKKEDNLYPGRFFYQHSFLRKTQGKCKYIVGKGLGDTLPIRYNCKKELVLTSIEPTK